mmetsp:Transcript_11818/g.36039  ORF Transcript_11818/g.36039 Transcript_11818/m.36039 type:complete len:297 (-) Transcript_11818:3422-4312(-)
MRYKEGLDHRRQSRQNWRDVVPPKLLSLRYVCVVLGGAHPGAVAILSCGTHDSCIKAAWNVTGGHQIVGRFTHGRTRLEPVGVHLAPVSRSCCRSIFGTCYCVQNIADHLPKSLEAVEGRLDALSIALRKSGDRLGQPQQFELVGTCCCGKAEQNLSFSLGVTLRRSLFELDEKGTEVLGNCSAKLGSLGSERMDCRNSVVGQSRQLVQNVDDPLIGRVRTALLREDAREQVEFVHGDFGDLFQHPLPLLGIVFRSDILACRAVVSTSPLSICSRRISAHVVAVLAFALCNWGSRC